MLRLHAFVASAVFAMALSGTQPSSAQQVGIQSPPMPVEAGVFICDTHEQVRDAVISPRSAIDGCGETKIATVVVVEIVERFCEQEKTYLLAKYTFLGVIQNGLALPRPPYVQFGVWEVEEPAGEAV